MMLTANCFYRPLKHYFLFAVSRQHSQSRENINFPEDEVVRSSEGGIEETGGSSSPGKMNPHQTHANLKMAYRCRAYHAHLDTKI